MINFEIKKKTMIKIIVSRRLESASSLEVLDLPQPILVVASQVDAEARHNTWEAAQKLEVEIFFVTD